MSFAFDSKDKLVKRLVSEGFLQAVGGLDGPKLCKSAEMPKIS